VRFPNLPEHTDITTAGDKGMKQSLAKALIWIGWVVGVGLLQTSCATTSSSWAPNLPEKVSAKGGASLLMKR
jgi:hypothetical protein